MPEALRAQGPLLRDLLVQLRHFRAPGSACPLHQLRAFLP